MARTIDETIGREALVELVSRGPRTFVQTYNTVAPDTMRILEIPEPTPLSDFQRLRREALEESGDLVIAELERMRSEGIVPTSSQGYLLLSTGFLLIERGEPEIAILLFDYFVSAFPEMAYGYFGFGEAYSGTGQLDEAAEYYREALRLDPTRLAAEAALRKLR
jgi:tetratricopeptide (TPR) repeat protein